MVDQVRDQVRPALTRIQQRRAPRGEGPAALAPRPSEIDAAEAAPEPAETVGRGAVGERLVRRRPRTEDKFYIPAHIIPPGWSYEWKRKSVYGQPDTDHTVNLRENHWTPVPASRHPFMMPTGHTGAIEKEGMVLMERPQYLTDEARQEDYDYAMGEVQGVTAQMHHTPADTFTRDHPSVHRIAKVRHSYGPDSAG